MRFQTGIALHEDPDQETVVSAVTWFTLTPAQFSIRGFTMPYVKENLLSTVVVYNSDVTSAVNAACHRTIETLLVKGWTSPGDAPEIELLVKPYLAKQRFMLPCQRTPTHWLLNAANAVLLAWLRGER
jgi:hypothetical protein